MTTMVYFTSAGAAYCMPVESTRGVRRSTGMITLPRPESTSPESSPATRP